MKTLILKDKNGKIIKTIKIAEAEFFNKKQEGVLVVRGFE